ncbi:YkvA family protein [Pararhodospirillum oryzae]|uniref:DUF1232 domain-containing protein n=1 Tax=Pararhodospirillum oryzae TaxID=478448 RepID=A0A512H8E2_9PROT|nr:YkvA family protein [Pararhodospirillum oryzae]GEO81729.1 hypothetical protein ROR02_18600 [Pararhodospirillum oryzae]
MDETQSASAEAEALGPESPDAHGYTEASFWEKLKASARKAGREVVEKALLLYYTLQDASVPTAVKAIIVGALAYFIMPFDAIPDVLPGVGYSDDLGVLAAAVAAVALYLNDDIRARARARAAEWFDGAPSPS